MPGDIQAPYRGFDDLRRVADSFLKKHHSSPDVPVPIEEIAEFQLGLDIISIPGLRDLMVEDGDGVDGFLYSDFKGLAVDEFVYLKRPNRYRFTLAHEIGHMVLHRDIYAKAKFRSIDEWRAFNDAISDEMHARLEYQANAFAGLVLVPAEPFRVRVETCGKAVETLAGGVKDRDFYWSTVASYLAPQFAVSPAVVERRLRAEGFWNKR